MIEHYKLQKSDTSIYQSPNSHKPFIEGLKGELPKVLTKDWDSAECSVCLEFPHKAVLLLCSSYDKGCRPYMCATSRRLSNCLEQYEKACTKVVSDENTLAGRPNLVSGACPVNGMMERPELLCPLCRGLVKGYTIVEEARKYLNRKRRACMQESCSFYGSYKKLKKHVKQKHPRVQTRAVDPKLEAKWKLLEHEQERNDVISTILSSIPGARVVGDYVVEPYYDDSDDDYHSSDDDDYLSSDDEISYHPGLGASILQQILVARNSGS